MNARCNIKELDDVLMRDVGDRIQQDGRWPLLIDWSLQVSIFLRYRDTNYVNMCSPYDTDPDRLRLALLGAIRLVVGEGRKAVRKEAPQRASAAARKTDQESLFCFAPTSRYHKPLVLDMMDTDSFDLLQDRFEAIQRNLLYDIFTKYVAKEEW